MRSHGRDGGSAENPFVDHDPSKGLDSAILDEWETLFAEMDAHGIVSFFFLYDDSSDPFGGSTMGSAEESFVRTLVNRFEHHRNWIWVVAEEYSEALSSARVRQIADTIRQEDDFDHPVAVHQLSGLDFDFPDDLDQFAMQLGGGDAESYHDDMVDAWDRAAGSYNLNMTEGRNRDGDSDLPYGQGDEARRIHWAIALGGAYNMVLRWFAGHEPTDEELRDCGRLVAFMEATNVNEIAPHDELAFGGTRWVLAKPGDSYIAYSDSLTGQIGLRGMTAGDYLFHWYDIPTGTSVQEARSVAGGDQAWPKPSGIGDELAVHITKSIDALCGDEIVEGLEQCDDGNLTPGDGCEPDCTLTSFWLLSGRRIGVRNREDAPEKRRLSVVSRDPAIPAPALASPGDPTLGGGILRLVNPSSGEEALFALAASSWKAVRQPQGTLGYVYREPRPSSAPCKKVVVREGRLLRVFCRGDGIDFTLNESSQGSLSVSLQLGDDPPFCLSFGGRMIRDFGTGPRPLGRFVARDSPTPAACPLP